MSELEKQARGVYGCIRCGECRAMYNYDEKIFRVCPSGEHSAGFWTNFPGGRISIALDILDGNLAFSDLAGMPVEHIYDCLLCANCREICEAIDMETFKPKIDIPSIVKALRADLFEAGVEVPEAVIKLGEAIEKTGNILGDHPEKRTAWVSPDVRLTEKADTVYFPGCLTCYLSPEIAQATAKILSSLDIEFSIMGKEEHCCGAPLIMVGQMFLARDLAKDNWKHLKGKRVITSCAHCHRTFKEEYPKMLGEDCQIDSIHIVELLANLIDEGKVSFKGVTERKVVYHDPCELGRGMRIFNQPRKILRAIPGVRLIELERNMDKTWCCGGGGGVKGTNNDLAIEIGKDKVKEALAAGARTIVSACPSCKTNINDAIKAMGTDLMAIDITELVAEARISAS